MILIPPYCHKDTPSSEKKVFNALKHDKNLITKNWIVYHSLNYPVSISKSKRSSFLYFGESDFLILAKDIGIINIEVKGGSITCLDGVWRLKSRYESKNEHILEDMHASVILFIKFTSTTDKSL